MKDVFRIVEFPNASVLIELNEDKNGDYGLRYTEWVEGLGKTYLCVAGKDWTFENSLEYIHNEVGFDGAEALYRDMEMWKDSKAGDLVLDV